MMRYGSSQIVTLLAGSLLAVAAFAEPPAPPRVEDFADYSKYIEASVDYQRNLEKYNQANAEARPASSSASKLCRDGSEGGEDKAKKKNSCEGRYLMVEKPLDDDANHKAQRSSDKPRQETQYENIEDAISRASLNVPDLTGANAMDHRAMNGLPQELTSSDLSSTGVSGLLGLFDNIRMGNLAGSASSGGGWGSGRSGQSSILDSDGALRIQLDNMVNQLTSLDFGSIATIVTFDNGYAMVNADVSINRNGGLHMDLASEVHTASYIIDRDGMPGTAWSGAGAATIDRMAIFIPHMSVDIQAVRGTAQDNSLLSIDAYSPSPITVDLSNTKIGAAAASVDGSYIGPSTSFLEFGPLSVLTINAGTRVNVSLAQPNGLQQAFVTLNGTIGDISLADISLRDHQGGGDVHIGQLNVSGIVLADTKIMLDRDSVVVDIGHGITNLGVGVERLFLGSQSDGAFVGDFYIQGARVNELRLSATPH